MELTAASLLADLRAVADPAAHPNRHYTGDGGVLGARMGTLFDVAKRYTAMPLDEVDRLLDEPEYEPRLAAFCVLDFFVRRPRVTATGSPTCCASPSCSRTTRTPSSASPSASRSSMRERPTPMRCGRSSSAPATGCRRRCVAPRGRSSRAARDHLSGPCDAWEPPV
ncbi:DNA alkylation repair enzyme [Isoptericola variabilis J7]|uniref:Uncharacterized protein n=1 Tax=Isoptericola variabilis (strain 225) TaxID=743718 RepID=F6FSP6_ISOV2|nr:DNA alkylation repair protein [Isoptericola variabilis]AEG45208.1 hypothetical protein Isova_2498 [Isoptericola variabilis 225]TWH33977.1 DNA alkylation repair enzyme [Isoptericola variabilis J7]